MRQGKNICVKLENDLEMMRQSIDSDAQNWSERKASGKDVRKEGDHFSTLRPFAYLPICVFAYLRTNPQIIL
jgi:hypothetical protein